MNQRGEHGMSTKQVCWHRGEGAQIRSPVICVWILTWAGNITYKVISM
ncbi:unnamed protein product [Gulo gulo]|uniref:Uncharacterized protein n=1 Tax=Gulo gulo TaxID=48420 RepID=A0A9X9Q006_GULGU|nr:unnamed protein product [Gulo gulo]